MTLARASHLVVLSIGVTICAALQRSYIFEPDAPLQPVEPGAPEPATGAPDAPPKEKLVMLLENVEDTRMVATVHLGNQHVRVVMDTGSPEQVIFAGRCWECGGNMYNCDEDPACTWGSHETEQSYGSGSVYSIEAHTGITMKDSRPDMTNVIAVDQAMVWLVVRAHLNIDLDGSLQGIFGLGPAASAASFAQLQVNKVQTLVDNSQEEGQYTPMLSHAQELLAFTQGVTLWQQASQVETFSFCLHPELGADGRLIFNDDAPEKAPQAFVSVPTTTIGGDDLYWQVPMGHATIPLNDRTVQLCGERPCVAVMDTGTSLIGAPPAFVQALSEAMEPMLPVYGCDDGAMYNYPDFTFFLGEHQFTLPPRSYVCKFDKKDSWDFISGQGTNPELARRMMHLPLFQLAQQKWMNETGDSYCAPCIFSTDDGDDRWLFGLPFFREYYTTFRTSNLNTHSHEMHFARSTQNCEQGPAQPTGELNKESTMPRGVQHIRPSKLRFPPMKSGRGPQMPGQGQLRPA